MRPFIFFLWGISSVDIKSGCVLWRGHVKHTHSEISRKAHTAGSLLIVMYHDVTAGVWPQLEWPDSVTFELSVGLQNHSLLRVSLEYFLFEKCVYYVKNINSNNIIVCLRPIAESSPGEFEIRGAYTCRSEIRHGLARISNNWRRKCRHKQTWVRQDEPKSEFL